MLLLDEPTAGMGHEDIDRIAQLIKRVAADRTVLMVEHNLSVVADLSDTHHRAHARARAGRGRLRDGVEQSGGARGLYGSRACLTSAAPLLAVEDLQAWYGESHILHGVDFRRARRRGGDAARPQRRRQDHDAEVDHGHGRRSAPARCASRASETDRPHVRPDRARRHRASARRSAASSPASTSRRTCCCRRWSGRAGCRSSASSSCSPT